VLFRSGNQARNLLIAGRLSSAIEKLDEVDKAIAAIKQSQHPATILPSNKRPRIAEDSDNANSPISSINPDLREVLDQVFFSFLARICCDLDAVDKVGERLHTTLIAKKLNKLTESTGFHPFKFKITAFCNAFREELIRAGYDQESSPLYRILKQYLWTHRFISRFNSEGKQNKTKGTHVWVVEARKTGDGGWIFKEFDRKIICEIPTAYPDQPWSCRPRVHDPQIKDPKVFFTSPDLPEWLEWDQNGTLSGTPSENDSSCRVTIIATYYHVDISYQLEMSVNIIVGDDVEVDEDDSDFSQQEDELEY